MRKKFSLMLVVCIIAAFALSFTACGKVDEYALSAYRGENKDANGNTVYNTSLFYSNVIQQGYPDPQVLDDTAQSGKFYLYGTSGNFAAMRSENLAEWEHVGPTFPRDKQGEDVINSTNNNSWAPEVIYDKDADDGEGGTGLYYLFFSSTPDYENTKWNTVDDTQNNGVVGNACKYNMYVATSKSPEGPFTMVDFSEKRDLNTVTDHELTKEEAESGAYAYVTAGEKYYEAAFPQKWAKYCLFAPDELSKLVQKNKVGTGGTFNVAPEAGYIATIDPSPFVDPVSTKKYLYFKTEPNTGEALWNINVVVEMDDWLTPNWDNAHYVIANDYYTISDWENGTNQGVSYENTSCNEGAFVLYHKDKNGEDRYFFTFSCNDFTTSDYQVGMAVSDKPEGPFRKLTEAEGGLLLCSSTTESETISGAGHHSFVTFGDQLFIAYHRHKDYIEGGDARYTAIDEVRFITVDGEDGEMEVPYVNGPTDSMQPLPAAYSGYKNVADKATVTCTVETADLKWLKDGLLSVHKVADDVFMDYVRETYISKTSTFTFDFTENTTIRAVMIYNSAFEKSIFLNIPKIEFTLADGSVRVIRDVKFDVEQYCTMGGEYGNIVKYVNSGSAAFAEFYDVSVKSIKITVEVPQKQERVGISEIKVLGKV